MPSSGANNLDAFLAEFAALRSEILQRSSVNYSIFALQLTIGGAIFSFSLSSPNRTAFLLILPVITYALASRYVHNYLIIRDIGTYIRTVLEPRTSGALHWEEWRLTGSSHSHPLSAISPLFVAFPGASIIALLWAASYAWAGHRLSAGSHVVLALIWLLDLAATGFSVHLIGRFGRRQW